MMKPSVTFLALLAATALTGCGGGSPLDNPSNVENPAGSGGRKLSFIYFQKCVNPVLLASITSSAGTNTCASAGCHDNVTGTGGALRVVPGAVEVDTTATAADAIRATDMYKNFYSSQGVTVIGSPTQSRLVNKPLVSGVLHGGGLIFDSDQDPYVKRLRYWIGRPMPEGQDEFSDVAASMFTPADPQTGACNAD